MSDTTEMQYSDEYIMRLIGNRDGYARSLIEIKKEIARVRDTYSPIPAHHVRKLADRDKRAAPLEKLRDKLVGEIAELNAIFEKHNARKAK